MKAKEVRIIVVETPDVATTYIHHYSKNRLLPKVDRTGYMCGACGIVYPDKEKAQKCCNK